MNARTLNNSLNLFGIVTFPPLKTLATNCSITTTKHKKQQKILKSYQFSSAKQKP